MASTVGTIEEVYLQNFLCHSELHVKLDNNITFLTGKNGSGKSAILTAITVALGQRASGTARGSSYNDLIKTGENYALVRVSINNHGPGAFQYKVFGKLIITERTFTRNGAATYKIMNAKREVISKKKEALTRILIKFNIQVDNPICILDQETAKNFLFRADSKQKFELFERAAQLDLMREEFRSAATSIARSKICIDEKIKDSDRLKAELEVWRKKMHVLNGLKEQQEKVFELQTEMAWAYVKSIEDEASTKENKLKEIKENIEEVSAELEDIEKHETDMREKANLLEQRQTEIQTRIAEEKREIRRLLNEQESTVARLKVVLKEISDHENNRNRFKADKRELENIIETLKSRDPLHDEEQRGRRQTLIESLEAEDLDLKTQATLKSEILESERSMSDELKSKLNVLESDLNALRAFIRKKVTELDQLKQSQKDPLAVYGPSVARLVRQFDSAGFQCRPKGPLGGYIKLQDTSWAPALESFLGKFLFSFVVDNDADARLLRRLCTEMQFRANIITQRMTGRMYILNGRNVECDESMKSQAIHSFLDVVVIDDPDVANTLIDWLSIDTLLLIDDPLVAEHLLSSSQRVPLNCTKAIVKRGVTMFPDPNYRSYPFPTKKPRFLQVSVQDNIQRLTEELQQKEGELKTKEEKSQKFKESLSAAASNFNRTQINLIEIRKRQSQIRQQLEELKAVEEPQSSDIPIYEEDLLDVTSKLSALQQELNSSLQEKLDLRQKLDHIKTVLDKLRTENTAATAEQEEILSKSARVADKLNQLSESKQRKKNAEDQLKNRMKDTERQHREIVDKLVEEKSKAEQFGPRIDTSRSVSEITVEMDTLKAEIAAHERLHGSRKTIEKEFLRLKNEYERAKAEISNGQETHNKLVKMRDRRRNFFLQFRTSVEMRVLYSFQTLLTFANFEGGIVFNSANRTLDMKVRTDGVQDEPLAKRVKPCGSNLRGLSGGERSFSTLCFILSLWDAIESPFRMLDEFDVFMDEVNRAKCLELLIREAKRNNLRQFVFLTPLKLPITIDPDIKILRLNDPER